MDKIEKIFVLMFSPEKIVHYSAKAIGIILSLAVIYIFYKLVQFGIERAVRTRLHDGRFSMVASLVKSALRYVVFFIMLITVLQQLGLNITALLASAGILGLAISFGAQNLVRDIISGIFIIFENQFNVGDEIQISGFKGKVETMSLRLTVVKGDDGTTYTIPNGSITMVQNFSR